MNDIKVLSKNFKTNEKRKISEALFIRSQKPSLNVQGMSTPLHLNTSRCCDVNGITSMCMNALNQTALPTTLDKPNADC